MCELSFPLLREPNAYVYLKHKQRGTGVTTHCSIVRNNVFPKTNTQKALLSMGKRMAKIQGLNPQMPTGARKVIKVSKAGCL